MKHASCDRAKRIDRQCRNHGSCPYCKRSRTRNAARRETDVTAQIRDGATEYQGEIEDGWTNYGMNRCYRG